MTMKKNFLFQSITLVMLLVMASCSGGSKMDKLLKRVPENVDFVVVGDIKHIIESAGGSVENSQIKLPRYVSDELDSSAADGFDEFNTFLKGAGIDPEACAIAGSFKGQPIIIFSLTDRKKFISAIEDEEFSEKDDDNGLVIYSKKVYESSYNSDYDDISYIAIKDDYAYLINRVWVGSKFKPIRAIERLIEDAADASFADTPFAGYMTSGNAGGISIKLSRELRSELKKAGLPSMVTDLYDGVICMKGQLDSDCLKIEAKWFDNEGKAKDLSSIGKYIDLNARISEDALRYIGKDEAMIAAASMKKVDWDEYLDMVTKAVRLSRSEKTYMQAIKGYLEKIDGTIAFGFGLTDGLQSIFNLSVGNDITSQIAFTMVLSTKEGKAKSFVNDLKDLLNTLDVPFEENSKGFTVDIPDIGLTIYTQAEDNQYVVISNNKISKNSDNAVVKSFDFADYISAWAVSLNKDNKLMRDLDVKNDVQLSMATDARACEATFKLVIKGGDSEGIIAKCAKIIIDLVHNGDSIEKKYDDFSEEYYRGKRAYDDIDAYIYTDSIDTDTTAVIVEEVY